MVSGLINVTDNALEEMGRLLAAKVDWPGACLRVLDRGDGKYGLGIDIRKPEDKYIDYENMVLLVVEPELADSLSHIVLDVDETPDGRVLVISE